MKQQLKLIISLILISQCIISQDYVQNNYFGKRFRINITGTFIPFSKDNLYHKYFETTIGTQMSVSIFKPIDIGFQTYSIFAKGTQINNSNYLIKGGFIHYKFLIKKKIKLYSELSLNFGNYCTCKNNDPYRLNNLNYLGYGGGIDYPILNNQLNLNFALIFNHILNELKYKYNYNIYKLGLTYYFGKNS